MIDPKERRNLKKNYKRLIIFLLVVFVIDAFIAFLFFEYTKMHTVLCGFIIIVISCILYLLFLGLCAKIDKRKERKREENKKPDPFSHK